MFNMESLGNNELDRIISIPSHNQGRTGQLLMKKKVPENNSKLFANLESQSLMTH